MTSLHRQQVLTYVGDRDYVPGRTGMCKYDRPKPEAEAEPGQQGTVEKGQKAGQQTERTKAKGSSWNNVSRGRSLLSPDGDLQEISFAGSTNIPHISSM